MVTFDFIECASKAYKHTWDNRRDILRFSASLLLLKTVSFMAVVFFALDGNFLRQGLVLLPSHFLEGLVISNLILQALTSEQDKAYAIAPTPSPRIFKQRVFSSAIIYTLLKLILSFIVGMTFLNIDPNAAQASDEAPPGMFILSILTLLFLVWAFRLVWLYIPVLLGHSPTDFLIKIKAFSSSLYMIGIWVMCVIPMGLGLIITLELSSSLLSGAGETTLANKYASSLINAFFDYVMVLVSSLGMAYAVASIYNDENKNISLL